MHCLPPSALPPLSVRCLPLSLRTAAYTHRTTVYTQPAAVYQAHQPTQLSEGYVPQKAIYVLKQILILHALALQYPLISCTIQPPRENMSQAKTKLNSTQNLAKSLVRRAGVRMTRQRRAVLETILNSHDHPTASQIYERTCRDSLGISLATVYNCLDTMAEAGLINQLHFNNGPSRYCPNLIPHVHLLDDSSNRVMDVQLKPGLRLEDIFDLPEGVQVRSMDACLRGVIPDKVLSQAKK